jgi:hypothetical protein
MNGKKAKYLRRLARAYTVGEPAVAYEAHPEYQPPRLITLRRGFLRRGVELKLQGGRRRGQVKLLKTCTRHVYKQFKKLAKSQHAVVLS